MFIKLNYQEVTAIIDMVEELTDPAGRSEIEQKALDKLKLIVQAQKIKYARSPALGRQTEKD